MMNLYQSTQEIFFLKGKGSPFDFLSESAFHSSPQNAPSLQSPAPPLHPARVIPKNRMHDPCTFINYQAMISAY